MYVFSSSAFPLNGVAQNNENNAYSAFIRQPHTALLHICSLFSCIIFRYSWQHHCTSLVNKI